MIKATEAVQRILEGADVDGVIEDFKFTTPKGSKSNKPTTVLSYNRRFRSNVVAAGLGEICGDVQDFRKAIREFAREAKSFMDEKGLKPIGKPFMCDDQFIWRFEGQPATSRSPRTSRGRRRKPTFSPEDRRRAAEIRAKTVRPKSRGMMDFLFGPEARPV